MSDVSNRSPRKDAEYTDERGRTKPVTKTNKFLQIGNAVPPKLAEAILREVLSIDEE